MCTLALGYLHYHDWAFCGRKEGNVVCSIIPASQIEYQYVYMSTTLRTEVMMPVHVLSFDLRRALANADSVGTSPLLSDRIRSGGATISNGYGG